MEDIIMDVLIANLPLFIPLIIAEVLLAVTALIHVLDVYKRQSVIRFESVRSVSIF